MTHISSTASGKVSGKTVTAIDTTDLYIGMIVSGTSVQTGTTISSIDSICTAGSLTLNQAVTTEKSGDSGNGNSTVSLTFTMAAAADVSGTSVTNITRINHNQLHTGQSVSGGGIASGSTIKSLDSTVTAI